MTTATISPKFQVVIPKEIREKMNLFSGMKVEFIPYDGGIYMIPMRPMKSLRGSLKGIDTNIIREPDRKL